MEMYSPNQSVQSRVKKHFQVLKGASGCWEWPMSRTHAGYGQLAGMTNGKQVNHYAHRVSYFLAYGPFRRDAVICHKCDNPACINPDHLFLGTQKDNMRDCSGKGRTHNGPKPIGDRHWTRKDPQKRIKILCGQNHPRSKLTNKQVAEIRASKETGVALAGKYGVSPAVISYAKNKKSI